MIIYLEKKSTFRADVFANRIEDKVRDNLKAKAGKSVSESEIRSWKNSLRYMDAIVEDPEIPDDTGIAIEFNVPNTSKRIDFILTGRNSDGTRTVVIVELKQWQQAETTNKDAIVNTFLAFISPLFIHVPEPETKAARGNVHVELLKQCAPRHHPCHPHLPPMLAPPLVDNAHEL